MTELYATANDLGYSSMKTSIYNINKLKNVKDKPSELIATFINNFEKMPSIIVTQRPQDYNKPMVFDNTQQQNEYFNDLQQHLDVTITSPAVKKQGRFLIGTRAIKSGLNTRGFDVNDYTGKSESDLSVILTLSRIAAEVVKDAYNEKKDLTKILPASVIMTTNLPIIEGKKPHINDMYKQRYMSGKHLVTLHNFAQPITVELNFADVYVGLEGEMAQFAITNATSSLKDSIFNDFVTTYPEFKDAFDNDDTNDLDKKGHPADKLTNLENVLGIDIGEGTTDFEVIANGRANPTASLSMSTGYGNVLEDAVGVLQSEQMNIPNRSALNAFLNEKVTFPPKKARQNHAKEVTYDQLNQFVDMIIDKTSEVMRHAGTDIELVYVYGGGSIPLKSQTDMREQLVNKLKGFAGGYDIPVVWIDKQHAQIMNLLGLTMYLRYLTTTYFQNQQ